jgi:hypothetical protein
VVLHLLQLLLESNIVCREKEIMKVNLQVRRPLRKNGGSMKMWVTENAGGSELPKTFVAINSVGLDIVT